MQYFILFGECFEGKDKSYEYMKKVFGLPDYVGHNLDALWDAMTDIGVCEVEINNARAIHDNLDDYGLKILNLFGDLENEGYLTLDIHW